MTENILKNINVFYKIDNLQSDLEKLQSWKEGEAVPNFSDLFAKMQKMIENIQYVSNITQQAATLANNAKNATVAIGERVKEAEAATQKARGIAVDAKNFGVKVRDQTIEIGNQVKNAEQDIMRIGTSFKNMGAKTKIHLENLVGLTAAFPQDISEWAGHIARSAADGTAFVTNKSKELFKNAAIASNTYTDSYKRIVKQMGYVQYHARRLMDWWWVIWEVAWNAFSIGWRGFVQGIGGYSVIGEVVYAFQRIRTANGMVFSNIRDLSEGIQFYSKRTSDLTSQGFNLLAERSMAIQAETNALFNDLAMETENL
jgi:hypothetical protein